MLTMATFPPRVVWIAKDQRGVMLGQATRTVLTATFGANQPHPDLPLKPGDYRPGVGRAQTTPSGPVTGVHVDMPECVRASRT